MRKWDKFFRILFFMSILTIGYLSIIPAYKIPNIAALNFLSDKLLHALIFFNISILGLLSNYKLSKLMLLTLIFLFGLVIEIIHFYHPYRYFEFADLMANLSGIFLALFIYKKKIA